MKAELQQIREALDGIASMSREGSKGRVQAAHAKLTLGMMAGITDVALAALDKLEAQPPVNVLTDEDLLKWCRDNEHGAALSLMLRGDVKVGDFQSHITALLRDHALERPAPSVSVDAWIPVTERLPEPNIEVLVAFADDTIPGTSQWCRVKSPNIMGWLNVHENRHKIVTHWMPLPSAPTT